MVFPDPVCAARTASEEESKGGIAEAFGKERG